MEDFDTEKAIADFKARQDAEDAKLTPEELAKVQAERKAASERYERNSIDTTIPIENVNFNGHDCLLDERFGRGEITELKVWGRRPDPEEPNDRLREGFIHIDAINMTCWSCGAFMRHDFDEDANTLTIRAESYEYDPMPEIGMEHPGYDDRDALVKYQELEHAAYAARMETQRTIHHPGPCPYDPEMETVVRVSFPSGKVVVDDDLRDVYNPEYGGDYNTPLGQAEAIKENAKVGCAYFPVGNSCPSIYRRPDGSYVIGSPPYDDEKDDFDTSNGWEELAGVCTDLWAASLADYEDFLTKGGKPIEENDQYGTRSVMEIPPGEYEFRYYRGRKDWDEFAPGETIYADFHRVGNAK